MEKMKKIVRLFAITDEIAEVKPLGDGLINDTYIVRTNGCGNDYVLQRINTNVFPDVEMVMRNISIVTNHIRQKLMEQGVSDIERRVLRFIPLANSEKLYAEVDGNYWRLMVYIARTVTKTEVNVENARAAGEAFGRFQAMLADVPEELGETIKDFHNMEFRLEQLKQACIEDRMGRFDEPEVQELLQQLGARAEEMTAAERLYRAGRLPKRICHCDTKVNNMLFSEDGSEVLCVIDLDTVMPSFIFSDYGDFMRTAPNTVQEDEADFSKIAFREDIYKAFTEGYLSEARAFLTPLEIEMLPFAARLFPYMQSVRFLWDYLNGDHYWKVKTEKHNLVRALNQYYYMKCIEDYQSRTLECVNWPEEFPYKPEVKVRINHDDDNLYIHYRVHEQSVRAVAEEDQGRVWEDSCVEFFCQPNPEDGIYYNFECNCAGKLLLCAGDSRHDRERAPKEVTDSVMRYASLGYEPFEERQGDVEWEVMLRIPKTAFFKHDIRSLNDINLKYNVYKCGDLLSVPHFVSLFPIKTEKPDFHRPEFFC